jgi:hypothetical protein
VTDLPYSKTIGTIRALSGHAAADGSLMSIFAALADRLRVSRHPDPEDGHYTRSKLNTDIFRTHGF